MRIEVLRLRPDAVVPRMMSAGAAGADLVAAIDAPIEIAASTHAAIGTGLAFAIPPGWEGQVRPRSGLAREHAVTVLNAPGTIDSDFRGELKVLLINHGARAFTVTPGMRVAQLVIAQVAAPTYLEATELPPTARGSGGFGSTGS